MSRIGLSVTNREIEAGILEVMQKIGYTDVDYSLLDEYDVPPVIFSKDHDVWAEHYLNRKKLFASYGLSVAQVHATFCTDFDQKGAVTDTIIRQFEKEIEVTAILGAKYIVIHPIVLRVATVQKEKEYALNLQLYQSLTPTLKKFGVKLAIENMYAHDYVRMRYTHTAASSTPQDTLAYLQQLDPTCFTACLDTGHANMLNIAPDAFVRQLGSRLGVLHVNDNNGIRDEHNVPYMGNIDWVAFVKALKEVGFDGVFCIEQATAKFMDTPKGVGEEYLRYAYNICKVILGEK